MKKTVALILALMMCLSLCACGGPSREEMLEQAVKLDLAELLETMTANAERAKKEYNDKVFKLSNVHAKLSGGSLEVGYYVPGFNSLYIEIKLSEDEMLMISNGERISVVGILEIKGQSRAVLNNAYLIK